MDHGNDDMETRLGTHFRSSVKPIIARRRHILDPVAARAPSEPRNYKQRHFWASRFYLFLGKCNLVSNLQSTFGTLASLSWLALSMSSSVS